MAQKKQLFRRNYSQKVVTALKSNRVHQFCWNIWYFVTKIVLTYCEKNCSSDQEKVLKFEAEGREFCKNFEITRIICSNSERSEQFSVTECFFNLFLDIRIKLEEIIGI